MPTRRDTIEIGGYAHVYNCGIDKCPIVVDDDDVQRFMMSLCYFNSSEPIASIIDFLIHGDCGRFEEYKKAGELVLIQSYCLLPNHFHLVLQQVEEGGIAKFMQRLGGYTTYFNKKHNRSGALFQGKYKSKSVKTDEHMKYLLAYVNMNFDAHGYRGKDLDLVRSSWYTYSGDTRIGYSYESNILSVKQSAVIDQFNSIESFVTVAKEIAQSVRRRKKDEKELARFLLE